MDGDGTARMTNFTADDFGFFDQAARTGAEHRNRPMPGVMGGMPQV